MSSHDEQTFHLLAIFVVALCVWQPQLTSHVFCHRCKSHPLNICEDVLAQPNSFAC